METASTGLALMVVGRLIAGAGVGFISAISETPNYLLYLRTSADTRLSQSFCICLRLLLRRSVVL
jgi:hypothetical protein